jgi:hypothetical protein
MTAAPKRGEWMMVRWLLAVLLALTLTVQAIRAAADFDAEEKTLTQDIEKPGLAGAALASAYMARGSLRLLTKQMPAALADYDQAVALAPKLAGAYLHRQSAVAKPAISRMPSMTCRKRSHSERQTKRPPTICARTSGRD